MSVAEIAESGPLTRDEARRLAECEAVIEKGQRSFREVGNALMRINEERLYRVTHRTFRQYVEEKWDYSERYAYRLIDSSQVSKNLANCSEKAPILTESQARELAKAPDEKQPEIWEEVIERTDGKPTAEAVKEVVAEKMGKAPTAKQQAAAEKKAAKQARLAELKAMKHGERTSLPYTARASLTKEASELGMDLAKAQHHFDVEHEKYRRAIRVIKTGNGPLIEAFNDGSLSPSRCIQLLDATAEQVAKAAEDERLKEEAKRHKAEAKKGTDNALLYIRLLDRTYNDWAGFRSNVPVAAPKDAKRRGDFVKSINAVRKVVNTILDALEKECD